MAESWSDQEDMTLRASAKAGESFAQCAQKLPNRSRNAVAGRAQRLGVAFKGENQNQHSRGAAKKK